MVVVLVVVCGSGGMRSLWCVWCGVVHVVLLVLCERERGTIYRETMYLYVYKSKQCLWTCIFQN